MINALPNDLGFRTKGEGRRTKDEILSYYYSIIYIKKDRFRKSKAVFFMKELNVYSKSAALTSTLRVILSTLNVISCGPADCFITKGN